MRRTVLGLGGAQVGLTIVAVMAIAPALGFDWRRGLTLGGILAMTSTAIVAKLLMERVALQSTHGRLVMGVLLFQDLAVVPLLVLLPALAPGPERFFAAFGIALLKAGLILDAPVDASADAAIFSLVARHNPEIFRAQVCDYLGWPCNRTTDCLWRARVRGRSCFETSIAPSRGLIKPFAMCFGLFSSPRLLDPRALIDNWLVVANGVAIVVIKFAIVGSSCGSCATAARSPRVRMILSTPAEIGFVLMASGTI